LTDKWGSLKDEMYKTNPPTIEELAKSIHYIISKITGEELKKKLTATSSAAVLSGFCQKGNVFRICCSHCECLLDFITNVMFCAATFIEC
jgi:hypothetical protein